MAHFIVQEPEGTPMFFTPGKRFGGPHAWVADPNEAMAFARKSDAQAFLEHFMPYMQPVCTILERGVA